MTVRPITKLELRSVPVPRSPLVERLEQEIGRPLSHEARHYLADRPVHCGDILELYVYGDWVTGRYEWTGKTDDLPTFEYDGGVKRIDAECLVRWPLKWKPCGHVGAAELPVSNEKIKNLLPPLMPLL